MSTSKKSNQENIHSVSSSIRQPGNNHSVFRENHSHRPLDYEKYFGGRSYQLFKRGIRAAKTLEFYNRQLYYFCDFMKMSTEQLVAAYEPFKRHNGKNIPNIEGQLELQKRIENYILMLQERVDRQEITPGTCVVRMPPIKLFCEMNDIVLNWRKIFRLLPRTDLVASDEAYSKEDIRKMLSFCDLRTRIIILFLASSGMRLGGLAGLKHGDLTPIYDPNDNTRVVAAHLKVYAGTESQYDTFVTPEAWQAYMDYVSVRAKYGESISKDSPVLLSRFNRKSFDRGNVKAINDSTIQGLLYAMRYKAGLNIPSKHYNSRFTLKSVHAFRKFWNSTVKSIRTKTGEAAISFLSKEKMLGHHPVAHALEENYDRSDITKELLVDYLVAVPELTISNEEALKVKVTKLEKKVSDLNTVEIALNEKDKQIQSIKTEYESRIGRLENLVLGLKAHIDDDLTNLATGAVEQRKRNLS